MSDRAKVHSQSISLPIPMLSVLISEKIKLKKLSYTPNKSKKVNLWDIRLEISLKNLSM